MIKRFGIAALALTLGLGLTGFLRDPAIFAVNQWTYAAATGGIVNTTTAVTIRAAGNAPDLRNYVSGCSVQTATLGGATELAIRDGAGGTVLWRTQLQTTAMPLTYVGFDPPLMGTAATLLEVVTLTGVTGGVFINCQGFIGP